MLLLIAVISDKVLSFHDKALETVLSVDQFNNANIIWR